MKTMIADEAYLKGRVALWVNGEITPEDFAAVLCALRHYKDAERRRLLDQMIGVVYWQIPRPRESEREWRKRVEARLEDPPGLG